MKTLKKIMAFAVCLVMVLAMTVTAFADDTTQTYTITAPDNDHKYEIYQIFTGTLSGSVLSDVKWGENGTGTKGETVDKNILDQLAALTTASPGKTDREKLDIIETYAKLSNPVATISKRGTYTVAAGYYLIKDKDKSVSGTDTHTTYIVLISQDITIDPKSDVPTLTKQLKDANDSTDKQDTTNAWQDVADHDIGDKVDFKLTGTLPENYDDYKHYRYVFHDKADTGLTFDNDSVVVKAGDVELTKDTDYTIKTSGFATDHDCTFEIFFNDLKKITTTTITKNTVIAVEYKATLNKNANIGNKGNVNTAYLEFSNNPNEDGEGNNIPDKPSTGETPKDSVVVFTYKVVINKKDENDKDLSGAQFDLYKYDNSNWVKIENTTEYPNRVEVSTDGYKFTFKGLDDGQYKLVETQAPGQYNKIGDIYFNIVNNHPTGWTSGAASSVYGTPNGTKAGDIDISFTAKTDDDQALSANVVNKKGSTLPSTGGIGTRIFYIIGGLLMAAAAVVLITKVRFNKNK